MPKRSVAGTAADPTIQFAELSLDGTTYKLAYSFNSIAVAESVSGTNLLAGLESLSNLTALQLRGLLYAALSVADPSITIDRAGQMIRLNTIGPITSALAQAYMLSMPEKKPDPPVAEPPAES